MKPLPLRWKLVIFLLSCWTLASIIRDKMDAIGILSAVKMYLSFEYLLAGNFVYAPTDTHSKISRPDLETGMDHLRRHERYSFNLDLTPYLVEDVRGYDFISETHVSQLMEKFIRDIKGLPVPDQSVSNDPKLLISGDEVASKPEWCSFPYQLKNLVRVEVNLYGILNSFYREHAFDYNLIALDSYLQDIRGSTLKAIEHEELMDKYARFEGNGSDPDPYLFVATHPVLMYRLVRRFALDLQPILRHLDSLDGNIISKMKYVNPDKLVFPTKSDVESAWDALERIQIQTLVPTQDLARGQLEHVNTDIHMTTLYALELGYYYYRKETYDLAIEWFHSALETARKRAQPEKHALIDQFIERMLALAVKAHNQVFEENLNEQWRPAIFNTTISLPFNPTMYHRRLWDFFDQATEEKSGTIWNWTIKTNFHRTCAGETILTEEEKGELVCYLGRARHLYWEINPLKVELLHWDPPVFLIHKFISDKLIGQMKEYATPRMRRSMVIDRATGGSKYEHTRTSSQVWMYEHQQEFLQPFTKKLEMLSLLTIQPPLAHDAYQVACYGPSHHYEAHQDAFENFRKISPRKGNRIVTIMGYLADVAVGGRTAFPVLGINTSPVKGAVVMWYNLKRNGEQRDERMWHGGCPVVLGVKWITNKWVYYYENFRKFSCGLSPYI